MSVRDDLIRVMRAEVPGVHTGGWKYISWYGGFGRGTAWCNIFVSWCAGQVPGMLGTLIPKAAACDVSMNWYRKKGWYKKAAGYGGTYVPQPGDIIYFSSGHTQNHSSHIGIVYAVSNGKVSYTNGNHGNKVADTTKPLNDLYIIGYGVYPSDAASGSYEPGVSEGETDPSQPTTSGATTATLIKDKVEYTEYTASSSDTLESVAKKYNTSVSMILYLNPSITATSSITGKKLKLVKPEESKQGSISSSQSITKRHTRGVTVSNPYAKVKIYTETGMLSIRQSLLVAENAMDLDILSISTSRDMEQDCPTFSINLIYKEAWYNNIGVNDLVLISMTRPPESSRTVFIGLVDDIRKSTDFNSESPIRTIVVTGRGLGKSLSRFEVGTLSELNMLANSYGFMSQALMESVCGKQPSVVVKTIMDNYLKKDACNYTFSNGKSLQDYFVSVFTGSNEYDKLVNPQSFLSYSGSLWNLLKELKDAPFNEMFWETNGDKAQLTFRNCPFDEEDWTNLERITIPDYDIVSENLGVSDTETYVMYKVMCETFVGTSDTVMLPVWYPPYYHKYGLTRLTVNSKYLNVESTEGVRKKTEKLFNWNILNNAMENGSMIVRGSNQYKVGTRVIVESTGIEYYVEGVSHNFTFFNGWTTTLSLTRGIAPSKRFSAPWGLSQQVTQEDAINIFGYSENPNASFYGNGSGGTSSTGGHWVKGKTYKAEFTAYCQNGQKTASGDVADYTKMMIAAPKDFPFNSKVMITDTGTEQDGKVYTVKDRGGAIVQTGDTWRFDILMKDEASCNQWGRRKGTVTMVAWSEDFQVLSPILDAVNSLTGKTINVPPGLGKVHTYMGWQMITNTSSKQYKLMKASGMPFDSEGYGKIEGRYVVATTSTYGTIGDYVDFYQENGTIIHGIIGDEKNQNDRGCTKWGHDGGQCIVEFVVNKNTWYHTGHSNPGTKGNHPEWHSNITKVVNGGNYFDKHR